MATKHFKELKQLTKEELAAKLREAEANLFDAKMKRATGQLENRSQVWRIRKDVARMKMLQAQAK